MDIEQEDFLDPRVGEALVALNKQLPGWLEQWGARTVVIALVGQGAMGVLQSKSKWTREEFVAAAGLAYDNARMVCQIGESLVGDTGRN